MITEWVGKIKAADWLPHVHIPDGNQNLDQNSLVKLPTPCIHVEKPEAQMEFCVWENNLTLKPCPYESVITERWDPEPVSDGSWTPEIMCIHTYTLI